MCKSRLIGLKFEVTKHPRILTPFYRPILGSNPSLKAKEGYKNVLPDFTYQLHVAVTL